MNAAQNRALNGALPLCPHRGPQTADDRWRCSAPSLVVPSGSVSSGTCRHCPLVNHASNPATTIANLPLVSCLMPTRDRPEFAALAIRRFLAQDYPATELVIIDDGKQPLPPGLLADPRIRYIRLAERQSIGAKRNRACREAQGSVLVQWDDDDWHGRARIRRQVEPLLAGRAEITGLADTPMLDLARLEFWQPSPESFRRLAFAGVHCGTLAFRREVSDRLTCYPDVSLGEDVAFLRPALTAGCRVAPIPAHSDFIYVRHGNNASSYDDFFRRFAARRIPAPVVIEPDLPHYRKLQSAACIPPQRATHAASVAPQVDVRKVSNLVVVTSHFNPCGFRRPRENYRRFEAGIAAARVPLWTVELAYDNDPFNLPSGERTLQVRGDRRRHLLWQKERLLNLLIQRLPLEVDAIAWIDADVVFLNPQWADELRSVLSRKSVVQLFADSYDLVPDGRLQPLRASTGWALDQGHDQALDFAVHHPGFAWAARADILRSHGLYDGMVTGSGDAMMVAGFAGRTLSSAWHLNPAWQTHYERWVGPIAAQTRGAVGFVPGSLLHLWHGKRENRRYHERLSFLTEYDFDPRTDLRVDASGLWSWTEHALTHKPAMVKLVGGYFSQRNEDE
jgi:glycosyltransferase involved in cell wall biosynthesis